MDIRLLTRTTRSVSMTEAGERLYKSIAPRFEEIDAELARGANGALGQLIATRRTLADQIAEQRQADEDARAAAAEAAKAKAAKAQRTCCVMSVP